MPPETYLLNRAARRYGADNLSRLAYGLSYLCFSFYFQSALAPTFALIFSPLLANAMIAGCFALSGIFLIIAIFEFGKNSQAAPPLAIALPLKAEQPCDKLILLAPIAVFLFLAGFMRPSPLSWSFACAYALLYWLAVELARADASL